MTLAELQTQSLEAARGFSIREISGLIGMTPAQIRNFVRGGLLAPVRGHRREFRFSFQDVVLLRTAKGLLDARVSVRRAQRALRKLKADLRTPRALTAVRIEADGADVVVREDDHMWNAESGQGHLVFGARDPHGEITSIIEPGHLFDELNRPRVMFGSTECSACRLQMEEGSGKRTLHPVQYLALAYGLMPELEKRLLTPVGGLVVQ